MRLKLTTYCECETQKSIQSCLTGSNGNHLIYVMKYKIGKHENGHSCFFNFVKLCFQVTLYLSWPVSIRINISYVDSLKFPAVTVCNYNRYRKSKVLEAAKNSTNLTEILTSIPEPAMSTWDNRSLTTEFYQKLAHQMKDTVVEVS